MVKEIMKITGETMPLETKAEKPDLQELQKAVGGYIQIVSLDNGILMIMDEEGKIKGKPRNEKATQLAKGHLFTQDFVVGDVVLLDENLID